MEISEFIEATARLEQYFGKEYTKEQIQIMFDELKDFKITRYKKLVSEAIKQCKFLPKVADFIQIDFETQYSKEKEEKERIECNKCNGTGYVMYKKKIDNGANAFYNEYAAVCSCGNAKVYDGLKIADARHKSDYYIPTVNELGLEV